MTRPTPCLSDLRRAIDTNTLADERATVMRLIQEAELSQEDRARISALAADLVRAIRDAAAPGMMEVFLAEYGLSTDEGIALMCLAEALLRVPDADTIDALIEDKIAPSDWGKHLGQSTSSLVNASTWALLLTGKVLAEESPGPIGHLRAAIKRVGEPVIRTAVGRAMKEMGRQFVLGETIENAMARAHDQEDKGYAYSYDMLGEAARTTQDAKRYFAAYSAAIAAISRACTHSDIRANPGISVKLSALHPRYEVAQKSRVMAELVPQLRALALFAKSANMGLNVDAEEADRLALSMDVITEVLRDPSLADWDGFGVVVQAYGQRAGDVLDYLYALAGDLDRRIMVRLVKGAYWDTEIKQAQTLGLEGFPVFTRKTATDISYIANARKLLGMTDRIYPQFATHNAHTVAAILDMSTADDRRAGRFEFQRLHGMGEALHAEVLSTQNTRCRIYAPVGAHRDLLAYLVRRLLENGANSSFVNQIVDEDIAPEEVARDPFAAHEDTPAPIKTGTDLFAPERANARGFDLRDQMDIERIDAARAPFANARYDVAPRLHGAASPLAPIPILNPADGRDIGQVAYASPADIQTARANAAPWDADVATRAAVLNRAADLFEAQYGEIFALLAREAGKTQLDAVAELREAVDFLRYYVQQAPSHTAPSVGIFTCISPWNFPLAIFSGQVAAALATGNAVLAKPAEQTPAIADLAVRLLHEAGVPRTALQLLPGDGAVGAALTSAPEIGGVAFTGSTETAKRIQSTMAANLPAGAPLIAETGGLNAMIVDSTALPEQAVQAVIESAFQSAGQRCSAARCLYVQSDIFAPFVEMLIGAMQEMTIAPPWDLVSDCGPVIDQTAQRDITAHIDTARREGRILAQMNAPEAGLFVPPTLIKIDGIGDLEREIFGPVLHIAPFDARDLDHVIEAINATGYGLTFGLHTRIDDRVQMVSDRIRAGNIYINRNQIGAVVGSQPFGGEGLSGTGPKAGGPSYLLRFTKSARPMQGEAFDAPMSRTALEEAIKTAPAGRPPVQTTLPGPTGESNRLGDMARAPILCMGPGHAAANAQADLVRALGGRAAMATGTITAQDLREITGISGVIYWGDDARPLARALAERAGPILPLITGAPDRAHVRNERHVCVDTTAAGGNAALLAGAS